jgi:RimJ/RimL family protein N-acetyltransferase
MLHDLSKIPTIQTPRLLLRGAGQHDLEAFSAMMADPEVGQFKGFGRGASREQSWAGLANILGHWVLRGHGLFVAERRDTREFVGTVGLIEPLGWPGPEISWTLDRRHWGQGLGTEAALAVRDWALGDLGRDRVISLIHPGNVASIRVAEKIGGRYREDMSFFGESVRLYVFQPTGSNEP